MAHFRAKKWGGKRGKGGAIEMNEEKGRVKLAWERGRDEVGEGCMGKRREMHVR